MPSLSRRKGKQPERPVPGVVIGGSTSLVHDTVQSPTFMDEPAMVPASSYLTQVAPSDDMAPEPSAGPSHILPQAPLSYDNPLLPAFVDQPPALYEDYPQPSTYEPSQSFTPPSHVAVSDWINSFQWVVPDDYTYELASSGASAHPAHDFLGHAAQAAEQQLAEIDNAASHHLLALRPVRGGERATVTGNWLHHIIQVRGKMKLNQT